MELFLHLHQGDKKREREKRILFKNKDISPHSWCRKRGEKQWKHPMKWSAELRHGRQEMKRKSLKRKTEAFSCLHSRSIEVHIRYLSIKASEEQHFNQWDYWRKWSNIDLRSRWKATMVIFSEDMSSLREVTEKISIINRVERREKEAPLAHSYFIRFLLAISRQERISFGLRTTTSSVECPIQLLASFMYSSMRKSEKKSSADSTRNVVEQNSVITAMNQREERRETWNSFSSCLFYW